MADIIQVAKEAKKKHDKMKNLPFFIGLWFVGVPLVLSILTEISGIMFTDADWRWWIVIIFGILALVMLLITKLPGVGTHPVVIILLLIFLGLEVGFFIWVVVEKSTKVYDAGAAYVGEISQSISSNPNYTQALNTGQEAAEQGEESLGAIDSFLKMLRDLGINI